MTVRINLKQLVIFFFVVFLLFFSLGYFLHLKVGAGRYQKDCPQFGLVADSVPIICDGNLSIQYWYDFEGYSLDDGYFMGDVFSYRFDGDVFYIVGELNSSRISDRGYSNSDDTYLAGVSHGRAYRYMVAKKDKGIILVYEDINQIDDLLVSSIFREIENDLNSSWLNKIYRYILYGVWPEERKSIGRLGN